LAWLASSSTGTSALSHVYLDDQLIAAAGAPALVPGLPPGSTWRRFWDLSRAADGSFVVAAEITGPAITAGVYSAIVRFTPTPLGLVEASVALQSGDLLPGTTDAVSFLAQFDECVATNSAGELVSMPLVAGNQERIHRGFAALAAEGGSSAVFGKSWTTFFRHCVEINEQGDTAFIGRVDDDLQLVWNGALVARTGFPTPATEPFALTAFSASQTLGANEVVRLADDGALYWYGTWDDPNSEQDSGIFRDLDLVVQRGVTTVEGLALDQVDSRHFDVEPDGARMLLRAVLEDGRDAVVRVLLEGEIQLVEGCNSHAGQLSAIAFPTGSPAAGGGALIVMDDAQALGALPLVAISFASTLDSDGCGLDLPGLGELLIDTSPEALITTLASTTPWNGNQTAVAGLTFPQDPSLPGTSVFLQGAWVDPNLASSEPVRLTTALQLTLAP
ncbi:MAG: hypothetical protein AAFZ65_18515, partial [Planctomycetota bacterium]